MKLFQKLSKVDIYTKIGVFLVVLNILWHLKLSFLIPEPFYSNNYSIFKDIEVTSTWICLYLFTKNYIDKYLSLLIGILVFSNAFSVVAAIIKLQNIYYYYTINMILGLSVTICLIFFILNYDKR